MGQHKLGEGIAAQGSFISRGLMSYIITYIMRRGMQLDDYRKSCISTFTTPFTARCIYTYSGEEYLDNYGSVEIEEVFFKATSLGTTITATYINTVYTTFLNSTIISSDTAIAHPMEVYWQLKDLSLFLSDYASSLATRIGASFGTTTAAFPALTSTIIGPTSSTTQLISTVKSKLNQGAKVGLGVTAVFGVLALSTAIFLVMIWRRKKQALRDAPTVPEMSGNSRGLRIFLRGEWKAEVDGESHPIEIDSRGVIVIPGPPVGLEAPR